MVRHLGFLLASMTLSSSAFAWGGGGVTMSSAPVLGYQSPRQAPTPGWMGCLGGTGFNVSKGFRSGGEGQLCLGDRSGMAFGGTQLGIQSRNPGLYTMAYVGLGGGYMGVGRDGVSRDTLFAYARPAVGVGLSGGAVAAELSVYAMLPAAVVQVVRGGGDPGGSFPHAGLQVSLLFGDFHKNKRRLEPVILSQSPQPYPAQYPPQPAPRREPQTISGPLAIPGGAPAPQEGPPPVAPSRQPAPIQPRDLPSQGGEQPLAIPR